MNSLEDSIKLALDANGDTKQANKAYLEFIKANFIIPVEKENHDTEPKVLFLQDEDNTFLPVFTDLSHFKNWAEDISEDIMVLHLTGVDLLKGIGDKVTLCLNVGSSIYKEFNPSETARMRSMVLKFFGS